MEVRFDGLEELCLAMEEIAQIPDEVVDEILNAQADIAVEAQRAEGRAMGVQDTGLMLSKIRKTKVKRGKDGRPVIYVYPHGSRRRGKNGKATRNAEIAFVAEYGRRNMKGRPFIRTANERSAARTTGAALGIYDRWLQSKNL